MVDNIGLLEGLSLILPNRVMKPDMFKTNMTSLFSFTVAVVINKTTNLFLDLCGSLTVLANAYGLRL